MPANKAIATKPAQNTLENSGGEANSSGRSGTEDILKLPSPKEDGEEKTKSWWSQFTTFAMLELDDGGAFMAFAVNDTGPSTMSTSNQTADSEVKAKFDSIVENSRNSVFNLAGGNIGDGVLAGIVETAFSAGKTIISSVGSNLGLSIAGALAGAANIDIPQRYVGSTASLPQMNYTIDGSSYPTSYTGALRITQSLYTLFLSYRG
jgi:hypothetical protein